ncbi:MAG: OsmC family protein [candidate division Zixibacteria bacterium]|nr:OsmC family protein [candidate division Zixibacteria bacterium]
MKRKATAAWKGGMKDGKGILTTETKSLNEVPYNFVSRFENGTMTNPEELIAAAHAGCFSMAFSNELSKGGGVPGSIETTATVTLEGGAITAIHLDTKVSMSGITNDAFMAAANGAKTNCPVSKLLKATITMDAKLNP